MIPDRASTPPACSAAAALRPEELARRLPVWQALSELFLDGELDAWDHRRIAGALHDSGFSDVEWHRVLDEEVAPACAPNLLGVAGEWGLFDPGWLEQAIVARRARAAFAGRFAAWACRGAIARDLLEVERALALLRQAP